MFTTIFHHITNAASSKLPLHNKGHRYFIMHAKSPFIHSEFWRQFLGSSLRLSHCIISVRFSIRLAYSCIFHCCYSCNHVLSQWHDCDCGQRSHRRSRFARPFRSLRHGRSCHSHGDSPTEVWRRRERSWLVSWLFEWSTASCSRGK